MAYAAVTTISGNLKNSVINNPTKIYDLIKNNELTILCSYRYVNIDYYKQLFELLKTNISLFYMMIENNNATDEYYKLLSDCLMFKTNLENISLSDNNISDNNCKLICDALKNSNSSSLNSIHFKFNYLNDNSLKYIIDFLKFNKTLKQIMITVWEKPIDGVAITELLSTNITINKLTLMTPQIKKLHVVEKAMENNRYITHLDMFHNSKASINGYCRRNEHNNNLKSLMLQDL
jgi:hypothetical protein